MEKRSINSRIAHTESNAQWEGGRQATLPLSPQGGGYLKIYTFSELGHKPPEAHALMSGNLVDPRLRQLREMGLSHIWQEIATAIGYDNFITMWQILDKHDSLKRADGAIAANIRAFRSQQRYQRDRFAVLVKRQFGGAAAVQRTEKQMCEKVGISHISRSQDKFRLE